MKSLLQLAVRGSFSSRVTVVVTAIVAGLIESAVLAQAAVRNIDATSGPYSSDLLQQDGLRGGLTIGLTLLVVPLVLLVAQCSQMAAPSRDRRLASYRLAGGTPTQVRFVAAFEAALPAFLGAVIGAAAFLVAQRGLDGVLQSTGIYKVEVVRHLRPHASMSVTREHRGTVRMLPTDVFPGLGWMALSLIAVPTVAVASGWLTLRRVQITPLAVVRRRAAASPPKSLVLGLLLIGFSGLSGFSLFRALLGQPGFVTQLDVLMVILFFGLSASGLILGSAALSSHLGAWAADSSSNPAVVMAGRKLHADPYGGSRTLSSLLVALVVAVAGQGVKADFLVITDPNDPFYASTLHVVDVAYVAALILALVGVGLRSVEAMATRRTQYSLQLASGVPVGVLRRSLALETLIPLIPSVLVACVIGILAPRGILGTAHGTQVKRHGHFVTVMQVIPIPWAQVLCLALIVVAVAGGLAWCVFALAARSIRAGELRVLN